MVFCVGAVCLGRPPAPAEPPPTDSAAATAATTILLLGAVCCIFLSGRLVGITNRLSPSAACALAFALNVASVSVPGRFDSDIEPGDMQAFPWPTLFSPAGFAFAIWGVIYIGEATGTVLLLLRREDAPLQRAAAASNNGWLGACVAQALWCTAFRPWALSRLWLSSLMLAATTVCLYSSQRRLYASLAGVTGCISLCLNHQLLAKP